MNTQQFSDTMAMLCALDPNVLNRVLMQQARYLVNNRGFSFEWNSLPVQVTTLSLAEAVVCTAEGVTQVPMSDMAEKMAALACEFTMMMTTIAAGITNKGFSPTGVEYWVNTDCGDEFMITCIENRPTDGNWVQVTEEFHKNIYNHHHPDAPIGRDESDEEDLWVDEFARQRQYMERRRNGKEN